MVMILLCLILGIAMLYLGVAQGQGGATVFGVILLAGALLWTSQAIMARKQPPEQKPEDTAKPIKKRKK